MGEERVPAPFSSKTKKGLVLIGDKCELWNVLLMRVNHIFFGIQK